MATAKQITLRHLTISGRKMIGIQYYADKVINALVKELPGVKWSTKHQMVVVENTQPNLTAIFKKFNGIAWVNTHYFFLNRPLNKGSEKLDDVSALRNRATDVNWRRAPSEYYDKLELRRYSPNTAKSYIALFEKFINSFDKDRDLLTIDDLEIQKYMQIQSRSGKSASYLNQLINAIKFYYEVVEGMPGRFYAIDRPLVEEKLPMVLSKEEVRKIISVINCLKHKCIVSLLYSAGLRRSELINLKIADIDGQRRLIHVRQGKGKKDRYTLLSKAVLKDLRQYYIQEQPKEYLFEGLAGAKYSETSIVMIIKKATKRAGIHKRVTPHTFRHSFATHLLEDGVDLRYIQELLGHSSSQTTERYTRVASKVFNKIKNPLD